MTIWALLWVSEISRLNLWRTACKKPGVPFYLGVQLFYAKFTQLSWKYVLRNVVAICQPPSVSHFFWCTEMITSTFGIRVRLGSWTKGACSITKNAHLYAFYQPWNLQQNCSDFMCPIRGCQVLIIPITILILCIHISEFHFDRDQTRSSDWHYHRCLGSGGHSWRGSLLLHQEEEREEPDGCSVEQSELPSAASRNLASGVQGLLHGRLAAVRIQQPAEFKARWVTFWIWRAFFFRKVVGYGSFPIPPLPTRNPIEQTRYRMVGRAFCASLSYVFLSVYLRIQNATYSILWTSKWVVECPSFTLNGLNVNTNHSDNSMSNELHNSDLMWLQPNWFWNWAAFTSRPFNVNALHQKINVNLLSECECNQIYVARLLFTFKKSVLTVLYS